MPLSKKFGGAIEVAIWKSDDAALGPAAPRWKCVASVVSRQVLNHKRSETSECGLVP